MSIHPSEWKIKKASTEKFCQTLLLPLGPGISSTQISTKLFNKIYDLWRPEETHHNAHRVGVFAQALRELRSSKIDLESLPQINARMVRDCYVWLDAYENKLVEYGIKRQQEDKALSTVTIQTPPKPAPVTSALYDQVYLVAVAEYIRIAGPMGDAKQIAEKAKAVARACAEEESQ